MKGRAAASRWILIGLLLVFLGSSGAASAAPDVRSDAKKGTERSGVILGGFAVMAGDETNVRCVQAPDCLAWHMADCSSAMPALPEPSLITAFVDVRDLAGGRVRAGLFLNEAGWWFGGATVQFWDDECDPLDRGNDAALIRIDVDETETFRIPRSAQWLTLVSFDVANVRWTLTPTRG